MPDFGIFRGFSDKLFEGELPTQLGLIGSLNFGELLLDLYPNAAAAYSLRLLRTAYTGSAIRVRRSSDNTEQDIGFSGSGELDTSSLTSFCGSGNGFVTTWYDQSGNARNATQTTATNQPQIVSSGSVINVNSKPSLQQILMPRADSSTNYFACYNFPSGNRNMTVGTNQYLLELYVDNINAQFYQNASTLGSTISVISGTNSDNIFLGASVNGVAPMSISHQELIVYASEQSSNRTGINTNINTYYGIY